MTKKQNWGFTLSHRDTSVRPQDDFFHYVSGGWIARNPIPETETRWGMFMKLRYHIEQQLRTILTELAQKKNLQKGSDAQMLRDFFLSGMDMKKRNARGLAPLRPLLTKVENAESLPALHALLPELHIVGVDILWSAYVHQDSKKTDTYCLYLSQGGLGMPDREYYTKNSAEFLRVRTAYKQHLEALFILAGYSQEEALATTKRTYRLEKKLADVSMNKEDARDDDKTYHPYTIASLSARTHYNWKEYCKALGAPSAKKLIVEQPLFVAHTIKLLEEESVLDWKAYYTARILQSLAGALSEKFVAEAFSFNGITLQGAKHLQPLWRRTLATVNNYLDELLGKEYVKRHFSKEAKKKALLLVHDLCDAYAERIKGLDWMSPTTKKKALQKLASMHAKIGYPDTWKSYRGLHITPDEYVENILRARTFEHNRNMSRLGKPIDRGEWFMSPQTVNAYFSPSMNDIVFPAAILQPPFFGLSLDDAINYGSMGSVIGHELTHGFDDQGSKRDADGNLKEWWTTADKEKFEAKAKLLTKQFSRYTVADGVRVNGSLTLGENIADLGGVIIAYNAYQKRLKTTGRKTLDGYTPEQRFFLGFALFECEHSRPERQKTAVLTDPHAPSKFRINGVVTNVDAFYETWNVTKNDSLYTPQQKRIRIW